MAKNKPQQTLFCRDCSYAYGFHEKNYKGDFFLCKCPYFKSSRFLNKDYCENFKKKHG